MSKALKITLWVVLGLLILLLAGGYLLSQMTDDYISAARVEEILMEKHPGAILVDIDTDSANSNLSYEIEYTLNGVHHTATIHGKTGEFLADTASTGGNNAMNQQNDSSQDSSNSGTSKNNKTDIQAAIKTALDDAGFKEKDVHITKSEIGSDAGKPVFDIEFTVNGAEYEYIINAEDGSIERISSSAAD